MIDPSSSSLETQRNQYIEDMNALQASLEKQPGFLGKIFAAIGQFFTGFLPHVGKSITGAVPAIWKTFVDAWNLDMEKQQRETYAPIVEKMIAQGRLSPELGGYLKELLQTTGAFAPVVGVIAAVMVILGDVAACTRAAMESSSQKIAGMVPQSLPDPATAIRAMFLDPTKEAAAREILLRHGLNDERAEMTIASQRSLLDVTTIQALYWRGEIPEAGVYARMRALGFTDARTTEIVKTWNVIPGPSDLIRMAVREAFSPEQVSALGLDEAFPGEVETWAAKVGLRDPWPKMYWRAHWQLPSAQMGFEMLHRGVIGEAELAALLKALDYSPTWHERLKAIAYNVVTRVDARRLYASGVYDEAALREAYRNMGYNPKNADSLTAWTKIEYAQGDKELTRQQIEKAYVQHIIDRREAEKLIQSLGYGEERTGWILDMAEYAAASDERTQAIAAVKESYLAGLMDQTEVRDRLSREEVDVEYIETLIQRWTATISTRRKLPSKTDLDKFLKGGLIDETEYKAELARLGYSREMADRYYRLNTAKAEG